MILPFNLYQARVESDPAPASPQCFWLFFLHRPLFSQPEKAFFLKEPNVRFYSGTILQGLSIISFLNRQGIREFIIEMGIYAKKVLLFGYKMEIPLEVICSFLLSHAAVLAIMSF